MGYTVLQLLGVLRRTAWSISVVAGILATGDLYAQCTWTWYRDADSDGFGTSNHSTTTACGLPAPMGYVANDLDCDDGRLHGPVWYELNRQVSLQTGFVPEIDISADSVPFVLYVNNNRITVARYSTADERWHLVGEEGFSSVLADMSSASIALDGNTPYVSYASQEGGRQLVVLKYTGTGWQSVGTLPLITSVGHTSMAVHNGEPYVVYSSNTAGTNDLYVQRYTAGAWQLVGGASLGIGAFPRMAMDKTVGVMYVSYSDESDGTGRITVKRFSGSWTTVGSPGFSNDLVEYPRIAVSDAGSVYVAYFDYALFKIVVQQYTSDWSVTGANDVYADYPSDISLAADVAGTPYVAYSYYDVGANANYYAVKKRVNDNWQDVVADPVSRGEAGNTITGDQLSIAVAPGGIPYIAFRDIHNSDYVSVMQVGALDCSLPVKLLYFKAVAGEVVYLNWATASEIDLDHFEVERTLDGQNFSKIGSMPAHGNSQEVQRYDLTDRHASKGKNYYRLKSVDFDGSYKYSALVLAEVKPSGFVYVSVYPNPNTGVRIWYEVNIEPLQEDQLQIMNSMGQEIYRKAIDPSTNEIEFNTALESGSYILKYLSRNGHAMTRFVVL